MVDLNIKIAFHSFCLSHLNNFASLLQRQFKEYHVMINRLITGTQFDCLHFAVGNRV